MEESEKRGRSVFARRQQQQLQQHIASPTTTNISSQNKEYRPKRNGVSDFMSGVAAGLTARKNNPSSSVVLPKHLDFSFRDKSDVSAKRRFQVKFPCRLMVVLTLVFLIVPGLIFVHKELHIHEDHFGSHYKTEKYVNVNTKDVWDNFRLVTTNDEIKVQHGVGVNATTSEPQHKLLNDQSGVVTSSNLLNTTVPKLEAKNQTNPSSTTVGQVQFSHDVREGETSGLVDTMDHAKDPHDGVNSAPLGHGEHNALSSTDAAPLPLVEDDKNKVNDESSNEKASMGTPVNTTATNKISNG